MNPMERKAFSFLRSFYDAAKMLNTKEEQADFLLAVCNYGLNGVEPEVGGTTSAMFQLVKPNLDSALAKAIAGAKGGKAERKQTEANGSKIEANDKQNEANESNPEPIKDKGLRIKDKGNNINNTDVLFVTQECDEEEKGGKYQPIIDAWNELPVTSIKSIRGTRLKMVQARLKEYTMDEFLSAISNIRSSPWLLGRNRQNWMITFDWFVKPNNFQKVYEGNYIGVESKQYDPFAKNDMMAGYNGAMEKLEGLIDE